MANLLEEVEAEFWAAEHEWEQTQNRLIQFLLHP